MSHRRVSLLGDGVMMPSVRGSIDSLLTGGDPVTSTPPSVTPSAGGGSRSATVFHGVDGQSERTSQASGKLVWERPETTDVTQYKTQALAAHRRWVRRNQVEDTNSAVLRKGQSGTCSGSAVANVILYMGFGMIGVGMIMTFVGLGERGFQTNELKLIGPSLMGAGFIFCVLRICFCTVGASCASRIRRRQSGRELISAEQLRAVQSGQRPVTHRSSGTASGHSRTQRPPPASAGPPPVIRDGDSSRVPVLPPIRVGGALGGPVAPPAEVLLDPQTLDRPPSAGSVMSPLTPARRRPATPDTDGSDIDEMLR